MTTPSAPAPLATPTLPTSSEPLLDVRNLTKHFPIVRGLLKRTVGWVKAVTDVSFQIQPHETFALVGESGCGKTTTGRTVLRLIEPTSGIVRFRGTDLAPLSAAELFPFRRKMQIVFQDPYSSLNPRMTVEQIVAEGLTIHDLVYNRTEARDRVEELLKRVGLPTEALDRYPHEFSGGQRQRIGVARALALEPEFIVCDEPVSALDVSVQAQVVNLLTDLQAEDGPAFLFIAHDLSVVEHIAHRVAVMYLGHIVEMAETRALFGRPRHPYTQALLAAAPTMAVGGREQTLLSGEPPSPINPPPGCPFAPRCPLARASCRAALPPLVEQGVPGHWVRCPVVQ